MTCSTTAEARARGRARLLPAVRRAGPRRVRRERQRRLVELGLELEREQRQEVQHDAHRGRQGRRVLHHDELRGPGGGEEARRQPELPGPGQVRPGPADADRERGRGEEARRGARRADRHEGAVRADQAARRRRLEGRARRHHARSARHGRLADLLGQRGRGQAGGRDAGQADRRQGQGLRQQRPAGHLDDRRAREGLRGGREGGRADVPRPAVQQRRPGEGGVDHEVDPRQESRPQGHLRGQPVLRGGRRDRRHARRASRTR